ncbi:hypothetical protein [Aequorivita sp. Q41]|uniref:hypothetical protein n=1 Tax=Aequorivita sp. Q41 TaxID=3153300 RepID=UPI0032425246
MKRDLRKQNLKLNIQLKKGQQISNFFSCKNIVEDIDDENYLISLDLTKNKNLHTPHYENFNNSIDSIVFIEIDDNYAVEKFKNYYISRYGNNKRAYLKNVVVKLIMGQTKTMKCDVEVEKVLRLSRVS